MPATIDLDLWTNWLDALGRDAIKSDSERFDSGRMRRPQTFFFFFFFSSFSSVDGASADLGHDTLRRINTDELRNTDNGKSENKQLMAELKLRRLTGLREHVHLSRRDASAINEPGLCSASLTSFTNHPRHAFQTGDNPARNATSGPGNATQRASLATSGSEDCIDDATPISSPGSRGG
jgi:hypothetical protein